MITQARLKELLLYEPETGEFYWRVAKSQRVRAGERAGCAGRRGYREIAIDDKRYLVHRLAWLYVYGQFPKPLDHKNQNRTDNRISNLREANIRQNRTNCKTTSRSGFKGAYRGKRGRWHSRVMHAGISYRLGHYDTPEEAHAAYCAAAKKLHGEFFSSGA